MKNKNMYFIFVFAFLFFAFLTHSFGMFKNNSTVTGTINAAEWSVSLEQSGVNNTLSIIPESTNANYTLNVKSLSEVDVVYTIVISNLPQGVEVALDNGQFQSQTNNTITFTDAGTILYSSINRTNSHTLTFKAVSGATYVNNQTVDIDVIVHQVM